MRKNLKEFDVSETIKKVINMQKHYVKEGVMLHTEFVNNGDENLSSIQINY